MVKGTSPRSIGTPATVGGWLCTIGPIGDVSEWQIGQWGGTEYSSGKVLFFVHLLDHRIELAFVLIHCVLWAPEFDQHFGGWKFNDRGMNRIKR